MDTLARIRQLAAKEFSINPDGLDPAAPLDTLGIDSLSFIEFMFKVEEEFGVPEDGGHRGADLVGHVGEELGLGAVGAVRRDEGPVERAVGGFKL